MLIYDPTACRTVRLEDCSVLPSSDGHAAARCADEWFVIYYRTGQTSLIEDHPEIAASVKIHEADETFVSGLQGVMSVESYVKSADSPARRDAVRRFGIRAVAVTESKYSLPRGWASAAWKRGLNKLKMSHVVIG